MPVIADPWFDHTPLAVHLGTGDDTLQILTDRATQKLSLRLTVVVVFVGVLMLSGHTAG